ncbi:MAG: hypothetical protein ACM3UU_00495 [Ignavibacteriales bacterium]
MIKKIGSFFGKASKIISIIFLVIALVGLAGMLKMNALINEEMPQENSQVYKTLIKYLDNAETNGFEKIKPIPLLSQLDSVGIVITDQAGNIVHKTFPDKPDSLFSGMTKFNVFSDLGGFTYILDQNDNLKCLFFGKFGKSNIRNQQKLYELGNPEWNNFVLSSPNNIGMKLTRLNKAYVNSDGSFSLSRDEKMKNPVAYPCETIIVKSSAGKFNLYFFRMPHFGLFEMINEGYFAEFIIDPFSFFQENEFREIVLSDHVSIVTKHQVYRDIFFIAMIIALLISLIFVVVWVFIDAKTRSLPRLPWALLVLLTNLIGIIIYLIIRHPGSSSAIPETKNV